MKPGQKSLGADPLDWIGVAHDAAVEPVESKAPIPAGPQSRLPAGDGPDAATLERELLLMEVSEVREEPRRRSRSNLLLVVLIFAFAMFGAALFFLHEERARWNHQVVTLQHAIDALEDERAQRDSLYRAMLATKDRIIDDKQQLIADLQVLHRTGVGELEKAWKEMSALQERYSNFFRVVFSGQSVQSIQSISEADLPQAGGPDAGVVGESPTGAGNAGAGVSEADVTKRDGAAAETGNVSASRSEAAARESDAQPR